MIHAEVIAGILRKIAKREITPDEKVVWGFSGNILVKAQGYEIDLFIDCGEIDYVDHAIAPDGDRTEYGDWPTEPIELLTEQEISRIERILSGEDKKIKFEVLLWDYKDSPPWNRINELIKEYPACHIAEVENTHDDSNAIIVSDGILQPKDVQTIYDTTYGYEA